MYYYFLSLVLIPLLAIVIATIYTSARHYMVRRSCYRRASLGSLVRAAKRTALARHYGRA